MSELHGEDGRKCNCCPGPVGPQGPQGNQGIQGIAGPQGPAGLNGVNGQNGAVGPIGPKGDKGDKGDAGSQGPQGSQGANGLDGLAGQQGIQGVAGAQGPAGAQGIQGVPGDCVECPCHCDDPEFAEVFSTQPQNLAPSPGSLLAGQTVILENTIFATSNIDVSQAAINGKIKVNKAGWYDIATGICGALNPIQSPLPCWTLSLFVNGIYVPGSTFANQTISPEQKANEIVADVFVHLNVGDVLELANTSVSVVNMSAPVLGTNAPASSAYLKLILLKAD